MRLVIIIIYHDEQKIFSDEIEKFFWKILNVNGLIEKKNHNKIIQRYKT